MWCCSVFAHICVCVYESLIHTQGFPIPQRCVNHECVIGVSFASWVNVSTVAGKVIIRQCYVSHCDYVMPAGTVSQISHSHFSECWIHGGSRLADVILLWREHHAKVGAHATLGHCNNAFHIRSYSSEPVTCWRPTWGVILDEYIYIHIWSLTVHVSFSCHFRYTSTLIWLLCYCPGVDTNHSNLSWLPS
jgi:hypothetical protein